MVDLAWRQHPHLLAFLFIPWQTWLEIQSRVPKQD
jgi:hypothetical protein